MNVVAGQHTIDNLDAIHRRYITAYITDPQAQLALQHLEPIFRGPDDVKPVIVNAMLAVEYCVILSSPEMSLKTLRAAHFWGG
jgi:hypothetical protein